MALLPRASFSNGSLAGALAALAIVFATRAPQAPPRCEQLCVRSFGAIGDGIHDDTAAIQQALNAAIAGSRALHFPTGTYKVTSLTANVTNTVQNFSLLGEATRPAILRSASGSAPILTIQGSLVFYVTLQDLHFDGVDKGRDGLELVHCARFTAERLYIENCAVGLDLRGSLVDTFRRCTFNDNDIGVRAAEDGGFYANLLRFDGGVINSNRLRGVELDQGMLLALDGLEISDNGTAGNLATGAIYIGPSTGQEIQYNAAPIAISRCWLESNKGLALDVRSGWLSIRDTLLVNNERDGVIAGTSHVLLDNVVSPTSAAVPLVVTQNRCTVINSLLGTGAQLPPDAFGVHGFNGPEDGVFTDVEVSNGRAVRLTWSGGAGRHELAPDTIGGNLDVRPHGENELRVHGSAHITGSKPGKWNGQRLILGGYHLWVDGAGRLRMKQGPPSSDLDGVVIGAQG